MKHIFPKIYIIKHLTASLAIIHNFKNADRNFGEYAVIKESKNIKNNNNNDNNNNNKFG